MIVEMSLFGAECCLDKVGLWWCVLNLAKVRIDASNLFDLYDRLQFFAYFSKQTFLSQDDSLQQFFACTNGSANLVSTDILSIITNHDVNAKWHIYLQRKLLLYKT